jgi:hypothetical protein
VHRTSAETETQISCSERRSAVTLSGIFEQLEKGNYVQNRIGHPNSLQLDVHGFAAYHPRSGARSIS